MTDGNEISQSESCNTELCPVDPVDNSDCECSDNSWLCYGVCASSNDICQRVSLDTEEMKCIPSSLGNCNAWGDPHVVTFDGAQNDVYGVANYVFSQVKSELVF